MHTPSFSHVCALLLTTILTASVQAAPAKNKIPAGLVGQWRASVLSSSIYQNTTTGQLDDGGGTSSNFVFTKDGFFKSDFYFKVRSYNIVTEAHTQSEGTIAFAGGKITFRTTKGYYPGHSNDKKITDRDMTAAESRKNSNYNWKWADDAKKVLLIDRTGASLIHYKRKK